MTISNRVAPVNILNLYAWQVLKANTAMVESDYNGKIPIIPGGSDPDFTNVNKPYITYGAAEDPSSSDSAVRGGTLVYAIYSDSVGDINEISNILVTAFERRDEAARDVNLWSSSQPALIGVRFTTVYVAFAEGAGPADQEGGRETGTLTLRFSCVTNYKVKTTLKNGVFVYPEQAFTP
jgi:hypothetical protein